MFLKIALTIVFSFLMGGLMLLRTFNPSTPSLDPSAVPNIVPNIVPSLSPVTSLATAPSLDTLAVSDIVRPSLAIAPSLDPAAVQNIVPPSLPTAPSLDTLAIMSLVPTLNSENPFNGPSSVSQASTTPTTNSRPTLTQMKYYNNYALSMYCQSDLKDLKCETCKQFKNDVYNHTVITNSDVNTGALVTVSETRKEIVVAFRGTSNFWNYVLDFATIAATFPNTPPGVKIHGGFHIATMSLYADVVKSIGIFRSRFPYKIVITGHSLGGAMVRLTQFYLLTLNQFPGAVYECYTFGEPRSGNQAFADYMNSQNITTARVVNKGDIVPHVAPISLLGTTILGDYYVHCQLEYWYVDEDNQRFCDTNVYEDPTCSNSLGSAYSVVDHSFYLGVSTVPCLLGQPAPWAAIPFSIFQPSEKLPPLPGFVSDFNTNAGSSALRGLGSIGL